MELKLVRETFGESTIGRLFVNGVFECFTLEDRVREKRGQAVTTWKVQNRTAIPVGTYTVRRTFSGRFQKMLPLLLNVPGFAGIRIHSGNTHENTEGCLLVGTATDGKVITQSRLAMEKFDAKLKAALDAGQRVTIKVEGLPNA
jgi:hypothetical protein